MRPILAFAAASLALLGTTACGLIVGLEDHWLAGAGGSLAGSRASCATILAANPNAKSGVYALDPDDAGPEPPFDAYCEMDPAQDGGGWTLALKIDGNQATFTYAAQIWLDTVPYQANFPELDQNEAKLETFSKVGFTAVRIGMIDGGLTRWIVAPISASSLAALLNDGTFKPTSLGPDAWRGLVASPSLQPSCNAEGFDVMASPGHSLRIGIMTNEQTDCGSVDSFIGFGGTIEFVTDLASGNHAGCCGNDQGDRHTTTFGYVMVR